MNDYKYHWTQFLPDSRPTMLVLHLLGQLHSYRQEIAHAQTRINETESDILKRVRQEYTEAEIADAQAAFGGADNPRSAIRNPQSDGSEPQTQQEAIGTQEV
jgi:hypothetical protein